MNNEVVIVLDFGCQHSQLISRKIREENVYCEVLPYYTSIEKIKELSPKGIILTGGPESVYEEDALVCDKGIFSLGIPVLGIGYGTQLMTHLLGGEIAKAPLKEYAKVKVNLGSSVLFDDMNSEITAWMGHRDYISKPAPGFDIIATSPANNWVVAVANESDHLYGLQFNPEVSHTESGLKILHHFLYKICHCTGDWTMDVFTKEMISSLKEKIGDKNVLCALSGGVDSSVAAIMISKAIGKQLTCIFVDHGLLRKNEGDEVEEIFTTKYDLNFIRVNVQDRFYEKLAGVSDPETKRKIIGEEFIRVFEEEAKKIGTVDYLVQGTIYPDVIESGFGKSAVIKSHHNVGGLPDYVDFKEIIEPLRSLFKDEVRKVGLELGIPENLVFRQPFPGPGLAIRIIGDITPEKIAIVQDADHIYREEIAKAGLDRSIGQYFAVLTNIRSVGVTDGARTYDYTVALRAVTTTDFMTAEFSELPWELLGRVSARIVKEVKHVNRIVYDITGKPPATIEFE